MPGVNFITEADESMVQFVAQEDCKLPPSELRIQAAGRSAKSGNARVQVEALDFRWETHVRKLYFRLRDTYGFASTSGSILSKDEY